MATRKTKKATPKQPAAKKAKKKTKVTPRQAAAKTRAGAKAKPKTASKNKPAHRPTAKKKAAAKTPARAQRTAAVGDSRRRVGIPRPAIEPGSLFDMSDEPSESDEHGEIDEALAEPLRDLTGEQRVTKSLLGSLVEADEDEGKRFADPSRVVRVPDIEDDDSQEHKPNGRN